MSSACPTRKGVFALFVTLMWLSTVSGHVRYQEPPLFSYEELLNLGKVEPAPELKRKLDTLRTSPFISNETYYRGVKPKRPSVSNLGPSLRIVQWNIERGIRLDDIQLLFTDTEAYLSKGENSPHRVDIRQVAEEANLLREADVLFLMNSTGA